MASGGAVATADALALARRTTNSPGRSPACTDSFTPGATLVKGVPRRARSSRRYFEVEARISSGGDCKNKDLHRIHFDRVGSGPYYTRPMKAGLPDRVDCVRLGKEGATLERNYALAELDRLQDRLPPAPPPGARPLSCACVAQ